MWFCKFSSFVREKKKEQARIDKETKKEEKKKLEAEKKAAKEPKAARTKGKRKAQNGEGEEGKEGKDHRNYQRLAKTATFGANDPLVLASGSGLPQSMRMAPVAKMTVFLKECLDSKPAIWKLKRGAIKKVTAASLAGNDDASSKEFTNNNSKKFSMLQASMAEKVKGLTNANRKTQSEMLTVDTARILGMDVLLQGMLHKRGVTTIDSRTREVKGHTMPDLPWIMDRDKLLEHIAQAQCRAQIMF